MKLISLLILFPLINVQWFLTTRSMLEIFQMGRLSWPLPPTRLSLSWRIEYASFGSLSGRCKYDNSKVRYIAAWKTWSVSHFCHYNVGIARLSLHCILLPAAAQPHVFHPFESVRVPRRCSNPPLHMKPTLRVYPANIDTSFPLLFFSCSQGWQGGHQVWRRQM